MTRTRWLLLPILLANTSGIAAEELTPTESEANRRSIVLGRKLQPARTESELANEVSPHQPTWIDAIHLHRKSGLELRQSFRLGDHNVILGLKGPVLKRKRFGLAVEIRF